MMQTTQKDIIFKIINSLMKYMDKKGFFRSQAGFFALLHL